MKHEDVNGSKLCGNPWNHSKDSGRTRDLKNNSGHSDHSTVNNVENVYKSLRHLGWHDPTLSSVKKTFLLEYLHWERNSLTNVLLKLTLHFFKARSQWISLFNFSFLKLFCDIFTLHFFILLLFAYNCQIILLRVVSRIQNFKFLFHVVNRSFEFFQTHHFPNKGFSAP